MTLKRIFTRAFISICALILILTLSTIQFIPVNAQHPDFSINQVCWGSSTSAVQAKPGDENVPLNVIIQNIDTVSMTSVTARLYLTNTPFTTSTGKLNAYAGTLNISPGQSQTFTFLLNIDPNAELKTYTLTMDVTSMTTKYSSGITSSVTIPVQLSGEVRLSTYMRPQTILPDSNYIDLNIVNNGQSSASNVEVTVNAPTPLVIVAEDSSWFFDKIEPLETLTIGMKLYAPSTSVGYAYTISVGAFYVDGYGYDRTETLTTGVIVENPTVKPIMNLSVNKKEITAGSTDLLNFTISNDGLIDAKDINIALSLPTTSSLTQPVATSPIILVGGDNFWHFNLLEAKATETFGTYLTTEKNVIGTYKIEFTLSYRDSRDQIYSETRTIGLLVNPKVPSSIVNVESYKVNPDIVRKGEDFTLTLNIKNFGHFEAQKVTLQLIPPTLFATMRPSFVTIGDLLPNESKQIEYDISVSANAQSGVIQTFEIDITFTDSLGVTDVSRTFIGIPLHGTVDLIVYDISTIPSPAPIGKQFDFSLTILNRGTVSAMYTNVSIISEFPFTQTLGGYPYIGELDINAPAPISLSAMVSPEAEEDTYPLKLSMYYQDEYSQPHTIIREIQIPVAHHSEIEEATNTHLNYTQYMFIGAIIAVAAVAGITAFMIRRRKSRGE